MVTAAELDGDDPADLLPLALSRPNEALDRARKVLADDPGLLDASIARQTIGIVLREYGDIDAAIGELRIARRLAHRAGSEDREADVLATLGVALVFAGRTVSGRNTLDAAVRQSTGQLRGRTLLRRGGALLLLGHHREALEDLNRSVAGGQLPVVRLSPTRRRGPAARRGPVHRERSGAGVSGDHREPGAGRSPAR
jgi:tetratricopeptide (TPR) repeat protein